MSWPILSVTTFLPLVGVLYILYIRGEDETADKNWKARSEALDKLIALADVRAVFKFCFFCS